MRATDIEIERAGAALLVRRAGTDEASARLALAARAESRRLGVVVGPSAATAVLDPSVSTRLAEAVREHPSGAVRLLVSRSGGAPDTLGPRLAHRLGVEVTAPDGDLLLLDDGHLFVAGSGAAWVTHTPAGASLRGGARSPAPWWQAELPVPAKVPGLAVTPVPVGWWLRADDAPPRSFDDPLFAVLPDTGRPILIAGAPGEPLPDPARLAALVRTLPPTLWRSAVLAVYGEDSPRAPLAQLLADELDGPVSALHGMPGHDGDRTVLLDAAGEPTWQPFVQQSRYTPGAAPIVERWVPPVDGLTAAGHASYRLVEGWSLDVRPAGVLIRPAGVPADPSWSRRGSDPALVDLAVTGTGLPLDAIAALARDLPEPTRALLRPRPVGDVSLDLAALRAALGQRPDRPRIDLPHPEQPIPDTLAPGAALGRPDSDFSLDLDTIDPAQPRIELPPPTPAEPPEAPVAGAVLGLDRPEQPAPAAGAALGRSDLPPAIPDLARPTISLPTVAAPSPAPTAHGTMRVCGDLNDGVATVTAVAAAPPVPDTGLISASVAAPAVLPAAGRRPVLVDTDGRIWPSGKEAAPTAGTVASTLAPPVVASPIAGSPVAISQNPPPAPPVIEVKPTPPVQAVLEDPESVVATDEQRRAFRAAIGWRYDNAARVVSRVLAERPGLRSTGAATVAELAAVRIFADDPLAAYDTAFAACLTSGLRSLPTLRAAVVRGGQTADDLVPGSVLVLRTPVIAVADVDAIPPGAVIFLVWTSTARRLDGLVEPARAAEVVLTAGTRFQVLSVDPPSATPRQVLLAELPSGAGEPSPAAAARLTALAVAHRAAAGAQPDPAGPAPAYLAGQPRFAAA